MEKNKIAIWSYGKMVCALAGDMKGLTCNYSCSLSI